MCVQEQVIEQDVTGSLRTARPGTSKVPQAVNDAVLTLTVITPGGESKGTFEVRAAERPLDLLGRINFVKGSDSYGQLLIGDKVLISDKTFVEQGVCSGVEVTLVVIHMAEGELMPFGAKLYSEGFDPELLCLENCSYDVTLLYNGTEVLSTLVPSMDTTYVLTSCKCSLVPSPIFNAPLFTEIPASTIDVLEVLRNARAKGMIQ